EEPYTLHERALGDSGSGKNQLLARREVLCGVDLVFVLDAHARNALFEFGLVHHKPSQHVAVEATDRCGCDHAFGRAAGAHHGVDPSADHGCRDAGRKIAITDQANTSAGGADVVDQLFVAGTIEDNDHQVLDIALQSFSNIFQIVGNGRVHFDCSLARRANHNLLHVAIGSIEQASAFGGCQHGNG